MKLELSGLFISDRASDTTHLARYIASRNHLVLPPRDDTSLTLRISAVGSKWDEHAKQPLASKLLPPSEQLIVHPVALTTQGARFRLAWPRSLPLGEILLLQLQADALDAIGLWVRIDGVDVLPATERPAGKPPHRNTLPPLRSHALLPRPKRATGQAA